MPQVLKHFLFVVTFAFASSSVAANLCSDVVSDDEKTLIQANDAAVFVKQAMQTNNLGFVRKLQIDAQLRTQFLEPRKRDSVDTAIANVLNYFAQDADALRVLAYLDIYEFSTVVKTYFPPLAEKVDHVKGVLVTQPELFRKDSELQEDGSWHIHPDSKFRWLTASGMAKFLSEAVKEDPATEAGMLEARKINEQFTDKMLVRKSLITLIAARDYIRDYMRSLNVEAYTLGRKEFLHDFEVSADALTAGVLIFTFEDGSPLPEKVSTAHGSLVSRVDGHSFSDEAGAAFKQKLIDNFGLKLLHERGALSFRTPREIYVATKMPDGAELPTTEIHDENMIARLSTVSESELKLIVNDQPEGFLKALNLIP